MGSWQIESNKEEPIHSDYIKNPETSAHRLEDKNGTKIFEGDIVHIAIWGKL